MREKVGRNENELLKFVHVVHPHVLRFVVVIVVVNGNYEKAYYESHCCSFIKEKRVTAAVTRFSLKATRITVAVTRFSWKATRITLAVTRFSWKLNSNMEAVKSEDKPN